ncbi:MAG: NTF2 fold immunity protein [Chitinophagales bacterium]
MKQTLLPPSLFFTLYCCAQQKSIPDSISAAKRAEELLVPIYGNKILQEKPFSIRLKEDTIWIVQGNNVPSSYFEIMGNDTLYHFFNGGSVYLEINRFDGSIVKVTHGK